MRKCNSCKFYNPEQRWNKCLTNLFGNIYGDDHGCWAYEERVKK